LEVSLNKVISKVTAINDWNVFQIFAILFSPFRAGDYDLFTVGFTHGY
jgi:hypothetical protein